MKELTRTFNGREIRVIVKNGVEWFVAKNVCEILGLSQHGRAVAETVERMEKAGLDGKGVTASIPLKTAGGDQNVLCVNEQGLYELIFSSRKEDAVRFRAWVTGEVLPSIRKTGKYDVRDIWGKSVEARHMITGEWKHQGVSKPQEYAGLTRKEYDCLFGDPNLKKADMDKKQVASLFALEAVEYMKLAEISENRLRYNGCERSISQTAVFLEQVKQSALLTEATA